MSTLEPMIADLALILVCAGVMTLIFKKLKQPLVLGYIVAGFLASPNMPYMPSVTDLDNIHMWSDIGVIFLLFALGLEFSFKKIMKMGAAPFIAAGAIILCMMMVGILTGSLFGWGHMDCIYLGGMLAMSSTTIIFKAFDDMGLRQQRFAGIVLSVLIIEDILAIVLMVMLSTLAVSKQVEGLQMVQSIAQLVFFLVLWFVVGIFLIPLFLKKTKSLLGDETELIVSLGLCFGMVVVATKVGFSSAFGAFIMGSILAETLEAEKIARLVSPVKDLFGAIFFVSVGMMVNIALIGEYIIPIVCIIVAVIVGQMLLGTCGFLLSGQNLKTSMQCGFSLTQIGEFAFILATLGTSLGVTSDFLYPIVVAVSVFTTFTTPYMIRLADPCYRLVSKHMPRRLKRLLDHYSTPSPSMVGGENYWRPFLRQVLRNVLIYGVLCVAIIGIMLHVVEPLVDELLGTPWNDIVVSVVTLLVLAPFLRALMRRQNHSLEFQALWEHTSGLARAPIIAIKLLRIYLGALAIGYVLGHTTTLGTGLLVVVVIMVLTVIIVTRTFKRQYQAMSDTFAQNFTQRERQQRQQTSRRPAYEGKLIERDIHLSVMEVPVGSAWAGKTLRELNLGQRFHIHVASVTRGYTHMNIPGGSTAIIPGDKLQVIGSDKALARFGQALEEKVNEGRRATGSQQAESEEMKLRRIVMSAGSPLADKSVQDSRLREDYRCMLVGVEVIGQEQLRQPSAQTVLKAGDILWVVGEESDLKRLETQTTFAMSS